MSTFKIVDDFSDVKLTLKEPEGKKIKLKISKTLDGNMLVKDHRSVDIIVMPDKGKIVMVPRGEYSDDVYAEQDKMASYLLQNGILTPDSVIGSNIYGALEGKFSIEKKNDEEPIEAVLYCISKFLEAANQEHSTRQKYIDDLERELLHPDEESSTELGEIPQEKTKGSIPKWGFPTRGIYRYNY
jgi:hypothetical protein